MHLSGQLSDWSIHDLLQIMQVTKKTGSLDIEGERRGRIHFRNGAVTGAELAGAKGSYSGQDRGTIADILYVLSTLDAGSFSVGSADGPDTSGLSVEDVVKDLESLRHLEGEVVDAGLFEAIGIRIAHAIDSPLTIDPDDWAILASLVQPFTFGYLEAKMGRGGAVRLIHTLHRLGLAEPMDDVDDEADLLGAVAGSVSGKPTWLEQKVEESSAPSVETARPEVETVAPAASVTGAEPDEPADETIEVDADDLIDPVVVPERSEILRGVSAPASTTLTDGVYDEIRRLRSKVADR
jgi:hypothetical protein